MDDGQRIGWGEMASHCQIDQLNLKFEKIEIESPKNYCLLDFFVKTDKIDKKTNSLELTPHETYPLRPPPPGAPLPSPDLRRSSPPVNLPTACSGKSVKPISFQ
jgi:hypothetical protein